ncbi:MAG: autotransporter domain-containing protein, partial [Gammaproteobacteria bacterium]|nr:autotransporter domain-containing protein [Gammaproteobacteria bacterium]
DNPAARAERLDAPVAAFARGVGMLAVDAVTKRARSVATTNQFHLGRANTAEELLRRSGFSLAGGDGGRGVSIWGSGGYISADGDHDGVDYDGDTSAFHIGGDTAWRDGLIGVAVSHSSGDIDFTVTADGMKSTLETSVTSVHPYLSRRINGSQLWLTAGYGSGDAELKEPDALIKTDITVTTAAFGIAHARGDLFTAGINAQYNRAKLDAASGDGKMLPATTADTIRITANAETGWTHGPWRPFLNFALRHDSGDGDTGGAADLGGGVEYQTPTVLVRLAGSGHIQGQATDEQRATLTVRKSSGNFALNLNLAADDAGVDTARLLHGEWRF